MLRNTSSSVCNFINSASDCFLRSITKAASEVISVNLFVFLKSSARRSIVPNSWLITSSRSLMNSTVASDTILLLSTPFWLYRLTRAFITAIPLAGTASFKETSTEFVFFIRICTFKFFEKTSVVFRKLDRSTRIFSLEVTFLLGSIERL